MLAFDKQELEVTEKLLTTNRAVRKRLDLEREVDLDVVRDCLRMACHAPTGSNLQEWRWLLVTDPEKRAAVGELYRRAMLNMGPGSAASRYFQIHAAAYEQADPDQFVRVMGAAQHLFANIDRVPLFVIPCIEGARDDELFLDATMWGSIFPAVWSFQLALRAHGLGTVLTTAHLVHADEAAELLGIPDTVVQAGLLPVGYITGDDMRPTTRRPVTDVAYLDHWGHPF